MGSNFFKRYFAKRSKEKWHSKAIEREKDKEGERERQTDRQTNSISLRTAKGEEKEEYLYCL